MILQIYKILILLSVHKISTDQSLREPLYKYIAHNRFPLINLHLYIENLFLLKGFQGVSRGFKGLKEA